MSTLKRTVGALMLTFVSPAVFSAPALVAADTDSTPSYRQSIPESDAVQKLSSWPAGPRLAGNETIAKYGAPNEITDERMIWHNAGPFKRILLTREAFPHHFPIVHKDYLEHTISYDVPADKADEVLAFDGAVSIYRVGGELSARCDLESNNILTLNLVHEIVEGTKNVEEAREAFGEAVIARTNAESPAITTELQFEPPAHTEAADTDTVSISGAPRPLDAAGQSVDPDAETLALLIAYELGTVHAASIAGNKTVDEPIKEFARMMHQSHGRHVTTTVDIGVNSDLTPIATEGVSALNDTNATALSEFVRLDGDEFARAYMDYAIEAQSYGLNMIDERLALTSNEQVKSHLEEARSTIAANLEQAREVQAEAKRTASL